MQNGKNTDFGISVCVCVCVHLTLANEFRLQNKEIDYKSKSRVNTCTVSGVVVCGGNKKGRFRKDSKFIYMFVYTHFISHRRIYVCVCV